MRYFFLLTFPLYVIDQVTKLTVLRRIEFGDFIPVIPGFFNLSHVYNTGAAFGMFKGNNVPFIILSAAALAALAWMGWKMHFPGKISRIAAALLASGVMGNLTDRLMHGHVIDFLDFHVGSWHWPSFNVADSCICIAAGLFLIEAFTTPKTSERKVTS
jgi:signal peptidase II